MSFAPGSQAEVERYSLAYAIRPEGAASMNRLDFEGSAIPELGEGEENLDCTAREWLVRKAQGIRAGKDNARSRGGKMPKPTAAAAITTADGIIA